MSSIVKALPLAVAHLIVGGACCAFAMDTAIAQTGPTSERIEAPATAQTMPTRQRILVTGSHIPRASSEMPSPLLVITAGEMTKSGYTNVSRVVRDIPQVDVLW